MHNYLGRNKSVFRRASMTPPWNSVLLVKDANFDQLSCTSSTRRPRSRPPGASINNKHREFYSPIARSSSASRCFSVYNSRCQKPTSRSFKSAVVRVTFHAEAGNVVENVQYNNVDALGIINVTTHRATLVPITQLAFIRQAYANVCATSRGGKKTRRARNQKYSVASSVPASPQSSLRDGNAYGFDTTIL